MTTERTPKIKPPRVESFPFLLWRDGKETRHRARLATQPTSCGAGGWVPKPAELAALIHKYCPQGAEHHMGVFADGDATDVFESRTGDARIVFDWPVVDEGAMMPWWAPRGQAKARTGGRVRS